MSTNIADKLTEMETLLREGRAATVRKLLHSMSYGKIRREQALRVANFARRVGLNQLSLKVLSPTVRPKVKHSISATDSEIAEYSLSLIRIGADNEGVEALRALSAENCPESLLYLSYSYIARWDYEEAIPLLQAYVSHPAISAYQKLVGQVNLASSLISCERNEAGPLLEEIYQSTKAMKLHLLRANCLELQAQLHLLNSSFEMAQKCIHEATLLLASEGGQNALLLHKWKVNLRILREGSKALDDLRQLKIEAQNLSVWEVVRECDLNEAKVTGNRELANKLFYGTASEGYHRRLHRQLPWIAEALETKYRLRCENSKGNDLNSKILSVTQAMDFSKKSNLKKGGALHRLLIALSRDFYKPVAAGRLFAEVFEGEHFDVNSSLHRVFQSTFRLRSWLRDRDLALNFQHRRGSYRMVLEPPLELEFDLESREGIGRHEGYWLESMHQKFDQRPFSAKEAREQLSLSLTKMSRLLRHGLDQSRIIKLGNGKNTLYAFRSKRSSVA